jgi:hypothetical protein
VTLSRTIARSLAALLALSALVVPRAARADVASWMYAGVGPGFLENSGERRPWSLQIDSGFGSHPSTVVVGGLFRLHTYFEQGSDLALLVRGASRGFVQGEWGFALDAGGYQRFWGEGSSGGLASLALGGLWGVTLSGSAGMGTNDHRFMSLTLGIDFARLTVHRLSGTNWFPNPFATDEQGRGAR